MLAGVVMSSILGGFAGLSYALNADHGLVQAALAYQLGGLLAMTGFIGLAGMERASLRGK